MWSNWLRVSVGIIGVIFIGIGLDFAITVDNAAGIWGVRWSSLFGASAIGIGVMDIIAAVRGRSI